MIPSALTPSCEPGPTGLNRPNAHIAWLDGPTRLEWREQALSAPSSGEVLCETLVSAISPGTELAAWRGAPPLRPGNPYPRVQGYCNVAEVLEVGDGIESLAPGDRVLTHQSHRSHFVCPAGDILVTLDADMNANAIATSYLFHLGYNALLRSDVRAGSRVAVIGLGVLGLTCVAMARLAGARVTALSDQPSSLKIASQDYGAHRAMRREDALKGNAGEVSADAVILTTNSWEDYSLALALAGQRAVVACLGFPGRESPPGAFNPLAADPFYTKQLRIEAVGLSPLENDPRGFTRFNLRDNMGFIARCLTDGTLDPAPLVSGVYPAGELARAYSDLTARKGNAITYLLDWAT